MRVIKLALGALHVAALSLFALKYLRFDVKSSPSGDQKIAVETGESDPEKFDRFVFFLLDAWRWDFLFSEGTEMTFLKQKIVDGEAIGLVSLARIPTVTKPCLKSIFAGTHPVFFEIVENIDESGVSGSVSTGTSQDNLLHRLRGKGRTMAVYGDDVWLKLFPASLFHRHQVVFGFNIMDYTEVDNLVHGGFEAERDAEQPSDVIILHYLGLDHIGHSYAARDQYVRPKLKEMDVKIEQVLEWTRKQDEKDGKKTLILMMGDHGMTHDGNHGGGSREEVQAAAVFLSPHFTKSPEKLDWRDAIKLAEADAHNQEDLAATLTALLDGSSPLKFGNGCLIERVMRAINDSEYERKQLSKNLKHLLEKAQGPEQEKYALALAGESTRESVYKASEEIKKTLNRDTFTFDEPKLRGSVLILAGVSIFNLILAARTLPLDLESVVGMGSLLIIAGSQEATSFIGEEHLLWQAAFLAAFLVFLMRSKRGLARGCKVLVLHRLLCGWNGIGMLWVNEWTLGSLVKSSGQLEGGLLAVSLLWIVYKAWGMRRGDGKISVVLCAISAGLVLIHKLCFPNYLLAQAILLILLPQFIAGSSGKQIPAAILFVLLNKRANAIPIALLLELADELSRMDEQVGAFLKLCTMQCAFYSLGLWNSVSAIDLTFGAIFSRRFDMRVAPLVLLFYSLSGPILVSVSLKKTDTGLLWMMRSILDFSACAFAYKHRFHPWVFDFFSPKILFQVFWTAFYCLILPAIEYLC